MDKSQDNKIILAMIMLYDEETFDIDRFIGDFQSNYDGKIQEPTGDNASFVFTIDGETTVCRGRNV